MEINQMKLCFNEATARDCSDLEQDIILCAKEGFSFIELRLDMIMRFLQEHKVGEIRDLLAENGIRPHALNAIYTYGDLFSPQDDAERQKAFLNEFLAACSIAEKIGSSWMILVPPMMKASFQTPYDRSHDQSVDDFLRITDRLSLIAEDYGINLCLEPVGAPKSSIRCVTDADMIIRNLKRKNVGIVLDAYNLYMFRQDNDFSEIGMLDPDRIFAVHMNNADGGEISLEARRFCDSGVIDLTGFLTQIKKKKYDGIASIETFRPEYWSMPAPEVIRQACRTTRQVLLKNECL